MNEVYGDAVYAQLARDLADALRAFARERRDELKKEIARLQTELCTLRREELREPPADESPSM
jgi:hypothetical protein